MRSRLLCLLAHPRFPVLAALVSVLLSLPMLGRGFSFDDYYHRAEILGTRIGSVTLTRDNAHLYTFADGNPEVTRAYRDQGFAPWWVDLNAKASFFRPLSALFLRIDYALWPNRPGLMHAHSLAWLFAVVVAAGLFYRRTFTAAAAAGAAVLLFAIDDALITPASWLAQRNMLLALFFGILTLVAHDRARADGWRPGLAIAPGLFVLALLSGESGVSALVYLVAYAVTVDSRPWNSRIVSLLPYVGLTAIWRAGTTLAGFGTANLDSYVDPGAEPFRFLAAAAIRLPTLFLGLFSPVESGGPLYGPPGTGSAQRLFVDGLLVMVLVAVALFPLLRRDRLARFFALGMSLSLIPVCAAYPANRLLAWSALGAMGLVVRFLAALVGHDERLLPVSRPYRLAAVPFALALVLVHAIVAPVQRPLSAVVARHIKSQIYIPATGAMLPAQSVVVVNGPLAFAASHLQVVNATANLPVPKYVRVLSPSAAEVELTRPDARTLVVRPAGGFLAHVFDTFYCSLRRPMPAGYQVRLPDVTIEVIATTSDGRPAAIACHFHVPLEDGSLRWMFWEQGRYRDWTPPAVAASVRLPAPVVEAW